MSELYRFSVRSSGRDLTQVRRPKPSIDRATAATLKKAELVALAEERGIDAEGTKADLVERLTESTDG